MKKAAVGVVILVLGFASARAHAQTADILRMIEQQRANLGASVSGSTGTQVINLAKQRTAAPQAGTGASTVVASAPTTTPAPSGSAITKTLLYGLKNDSQVMTLQTFLAAKGYLTVAPDGNFGPKTLAAVKKFQSANGLDPIGLVGPKTRAIINK